MYSWGHRGGSDYSGKIEDAVSSRDRDDLNPVDLSNFSLNEEFYRGRGDRSRSEGSMDIASTDGQSRRKYDGTGDGVSSYSAHSS